MKGEMIMRSEARILVLAKKTDTWKEKLVYKITFSQNNNEIVGERILRKELWDMVEPNKMYIFLLEEASGSNGKYTKIVSITEAK